MSAIAAARSVLRSSAAARLAAGAKLPKSSPSPFRIPKHNSTNSPFISRLPVEMSCAMESMIPFHTATASALLTSMLSHSPRIYYWWTLKDA